MKPFISKNKTWMDNLIVQGITIFVLLFQAVLCIFAVLFSLAWWAGIGFLVYTVIAFLWSHMGAGVHP